MTIQTIRGLNVDAVKIGGLERAEEKLIRNSNNNYIIFYSNVIVNHQLD
jgi:hypothetical protein